MSRPARVDLTWIMLRALTYPADAAARWRDDGDSRPPADWQLRADPAGWQAHG